MLKRKIALAGAFILIIAVLASCRSSREYDYNRYPPPPPRTSVSLIIHGGPGVIVSRHPSGRYYYRAPNGYMYWRGYGNRYYLDRRYMNRGYYQHRQYNDWRRYHNRGRW